MKRIGVLVSGGGSNLQAIIDAIENGYIDAEIAMVISNKAGVYALERAAKHHIPATVIDHRLYASSVDFSEAICQCLQKNQVDLVCLAGFLRILNRNLIEAYPYRILNIHPALLPAFGGSGMYGHYVHEAVIASGTKYSGATVHFVTAETDVGPIIAQEVVTVDDTDNSDTLAAKVLKVEHTTYPLALKLVLEEKIVIDGLRVKLKR